MRLLRLLGVGSFLLASVTSLSAPAAAGTRFWVYADVEVVCDGGCDPGVSITGSVIAQIREIADVHEDLPWYHTGSIHRGCSAHGLILNQTTSTVDNGSAPNAVGDSSSILLLAQGIDRWGYVARSTANIGGTGGTPLVLQWNASSCRSKDCGGPPQLP